MNKNTIYLAVAIIVFIVIVPFSAFAVPSTARTACGTVRSIDHNQRRIVFSSYSKAEPMVVAIIDRTEFYQDGESVPFESLENGMIAELVYKRPLFGERFALKLRWETKVREPMTICSQKGH